MNRMWYIREWSKYIRIFTAYQLTRDFNKLCDSFASTSASFCISLPYKRFHHRCPKDTKGASHFVITQDIFLSYLPYFSNCRGFGRTIPWGCLQKKHLHPRNLTWNLKISPFSKGKSIFGNHIVSGSMFNFGGVLSVWFFYDQKVQCSVGTYRFSMGHLFCLFGLAQALDHHRTNTRHGRALVFVEQKNWVVATQRFFHVHPYLGKMNPFWLIFFTWVETTN